MSESTSNQAPHQPGVYVKDGRARVATTPAAAVALVFDGYRRQADSNALETVKPKPLEGNKRNGEPLDANKDGKVDGLQDVKATPTPRAPRIKPTTSEETA